MTWGILDQSFTPPMLEAAYFLFLPEKNEILWSNTLSLWASPQIYHGDIERWVATMDGAPVIPIDPHLALSLTWLAVDEMVYNMPYVNDHVKAALKLIKDIKDEEHGDDKEGLSTDSDSTS